MRSDREVATLGGGCFWCLEAIFAEIEGVEQVVSGYSGGTVDHPDYHQVCAGNTGHAEVVQVTFNPKIITYRALLKIFFAMHDPTTLNRQGADVGTQYRSVIFYDTPEQKADAEEAIKEIETAQSWNGSIVTEVVPFSAFHHAEDYHQDYYKNNPDQPYCRTMISPKLTKLHRQYLTMLKK